MVNNTLPTEYQAFIHKSRYSRWLDLHSRRESWEETVDRYMDFMESFLAKNNDYVMDKHLKSVLRDAILNLEIMPSMRAMMTAGPALERNNIAGYNCSYIPVDSPRAFDECMYILMCGTGVGYSVESRYVSKLPPVSDEFTHSDTVITVADSKEGWATALKELVAMLYAGQIPSWDTSRVRPAGSRLKTFGGRASGPEPLENLFSFVVKVFQKAAGRQLSDIECHDIMCMIGDVVVVGGVRRSAMISLSDLGSDAIRHAKTGSWFDVTPYRRLANNSAVYEDKPDVGTFMREWTSLYESHSGERGIFNRKASTLAAAKNGRRDTSYEFGTNPCSEIILRPNQFCNLTEVVVREHDTVETLTEKVHLATILGTFQSCLTNFKYIRKIWTKNTEEERLLGVSLTGILDNAILNGKQGHLPLYNALIKMREQAVTTNSVFADEIGIPVSTAITCVKPSGTVSQLVDAASGIHPRHSMYYIRRVRGDVKDPITQFMAEQGIPSEPDAGNPDSNVVFSFPTKAPEGALTRHDMTAVEHLDLWKTYQTYWCEHKPSITVSVKDHEWLDVAAWVWQNFDCISGISFLPYSGGNYVQAPYEEVDKETYEELLASMPTSIDWEALAGYEFEDKTASAQTFACSGDSCEIVDLTA